MTAYGRAWQVAQREVQHHLTLSRAPCPTPTLNAARIRGLTRQVFATGTRRQLDDLTRSIWREYDRPENTEALARLKTVILARRAALDQTPER